MSPLRAEHPHDRVIAWRDRPLETLLDEFGLAGVPERPFPTDGWSGSTFTALERGRERFVLKRTAADRDWIVRATLDDDVREAWLASHAGDVQVALDALTGTIELPYLGGAIDGDGVAAILMPDLSSELAAWERPAHAPVLDPVRLERLLDRIARLHAVPWSETLAAQTARAEEPAPWCPLPERLTLLTRRSATGYAAAGNPVGEIFLRGWDAFDQLATPAARDLLDRLGADPAPLIRALAGLPSVGLHGDIKLANVAVLEGDRIAFIDWQMTLRAPVAVELGWFIVTNSAELPLPPEEVLAGYRGAIGRYARPGGSGRRTFDLDGLVGDWDLQCDLAAIIGLLLRGWRKGRDADDGATLASGVPAADDLAWWCARAVEAAGRRL